MDKDHNVLDEFQEEIAKRIIKEYDSSRRFWLFADDVGVGKTIMYITVNQHAAEQRERIGGKRHMTFVFSMSSSLKEQAEKIRATDTRIPNNPFIKPTDILIFDGDKETRDSLLMAIQAIRPKYVLANYAKLNLHPKEFLELMDEDTSLILDEIDLYHNNDSMTSQIITGLCCVVHARWLATATMVANKIDSLHPLLMYADPGQAVVEEVETHVGKVMMPQTSESQEFGGMTHFLNRYGLFDGQKLAGVSRPKELRERLLRWGASITDADDVLDIDVAPPETRKDPLAPGQAVIYQAIKDGIKNWIDENEYEYLRSSGGERIKFEMQLLAQIVYGRRASALPPYDFKLAEMKNLAIRAAKAGHRKKDDVMGKLEWATLPNDRQSAKLDAACKIVEEFDFSKGGVAFYSEWTAVARALERQLKERGLDKHGLGLITGEESDAERQATRLGVKYGNIKVCIISDAGGRSLDLFQLSTLVVLTPPWCHSQVEQAVGRIKRRGQKNTVRVIYLAADSTVETKKMLSIIGQKGKVADSVRYGDRGKRTSPLMGLDSLSQVLAWL